MSINTQHIKEWANSPAISFAHVAAHGTTSISTYQIDCALLHERFITENILDSDEFKDLFRELQALQKNPCVYVFEIVSDIPPQTVVEHISQLEGVIRPSIRKRYDADSKILYVGKVKSLFWGRLIMHMGLHTNKKKEGQSVAHGLQLRHWAKELNLKLNLHLYTFEPDLADYMEIMERLFAKELKPIIGRH